jgi:hypothetical protein
MSKTVYQANRYGMFCGETVADESPLEPGVYHLPAGTVETAPPASWPDDKWPRWNGSAWELVNRPQAPSAEARAKALAAQLTRLQEQMTALQKEISGDVE